MTESKKYVSRLIPIVLLVIITHFVLVKLDFFEIIDRVAILMEIILGLLFMLGTVIVVPAFKQAPDQLVGKFMVLTTVQLLSVLALFGAFVYTKIPYFKVSIFHCLILFVVLMVIQSILLIGVVNRLNKKS